MHYFLIMPGIGSNLDVVKISFIVFGVGSLDSNLRVVCFEVSFIIIDMGYLDVNLGLLYVCAQW
jgi:hypothetical protein